MAFGNHFHNILSIGGTLTSVEDLGPSSSSGKKCRFTLRNPSRTKRKFDTYVHGFAYGGNAAQMLDGIDEVVTIEGRLGSDRGKNIVLVDKVFFVDEEPRYTDEEEDNEVTIIRR